MITSETKVIACIVYQRGWWLCGVMCCKYSLICLELSLIPGYRVAQSCMYIERSINPDIVAGEVEAEELPESFTDLPSVCIIGH